MRIRDKEAKGLEHAFRIALMAEAHTAVHVIVEVVETPKVKYYAASAMSAMSIKEATVAVVSSERTGKDGFDKRCNKMCEIMEIVRVRPGLVFY